MKQKMCSSKIVGAFLAMVSVWLILVPTVQASMSSSNYRIDWDTTSGGGSDTSFSPSYGLRDTFGNPAIGSSSSDSYLLRAGYRGGVEDVLLAFQIQAEQTSSQKAISALVGTTVSVSSSSGFTTGDYAAIIQDVGENQVSAFGKVASTTASSITFDNLTTGGVSPTIDGSNDSIFLLQGDDITFTELDSALLRTALIGWEITSTTENGYSVQVFDDGNLRSGSDDIDDVTDSTVTEGSEEYGGRSSDTSITSSTFDTQDTALTTTPQAIGTSLTSAVADRDFLTLKVSIDSATEDGTYGQAITLIATGNY